MSSGELLLAWYAIPVPIPMRVAAALLIEQRLFIRSHLGAIVFTSASETLFGWWASGSMRVLTLLINRVMRVFRVVKTVDSRMPASLKMPQ